jgi:hypothetical protein
MSGMTGPFGAFRKEGADGEKGAPPEIIGLCHLEGQTLWCH